jgi:hypothetical protein
MEQLFMDLRLLRIYRILKTDGVAMMSILDTFDIIVANNFYV